MLGNLSQANDIVNYARDSGSEAAEKSENELKEEFFRRILDRNSKTHNRPSPNESQYLDTYVNLIRQIAASKSESVNDQGFFLVKYLEKVSVGNSSANMQTILNRSGLIDVKPLSNNQLLYRFSPFWLHRYLVENYNKAIDGISLARTVAVTIFGLGILISCVYLVRRPGQLRNNSVA
jgi:hypothetical protein